eukprot:CAMPEP_0113556238 /NCGR_PEP_ID=MMETSP0015_2-20120614/17151_1 /TAXON_ID=2838 /ORGANISM="Odontella" /LENGTH=196 /DNA_ID=CAMNT_0000457583 /DNA_START=167 /DNA_END=757 /DNA_ORIENTATION=+ /assembly_acc=CAM_ASM_000160
MRDVRTNSTEFAAYAKRAMRLLAEDAIAELPTKSVEITTPCGPSTGVEIATDNLCAVSIIRAGDSLLESVRECLPGVRVGKILIQRDESSEEKEPKMFYAKMPPGVSDMNVLLCDPMLATGGSAKMAISTLVSEYDVKPERIIFANVICCPEGLDAMATAYPEVKIVTACIDEGLNGEKYIVPGLGDYGDRFFGTV